MVRNPVEPEYVQTTSSERLIGLFKTELKEIANKTLEKMAVEVCMALIDSGDWTEEKICLREK